MLDEVDDHTALTDRPTSTALGCWRSPGQSYSREMRLAATDWGIPLAEISVPTIIWQGGLDDVHTPAMASWLHAMIPGSRLVVREDDATFNFFDDIGDVLTALREVPDA